MNSQSTSGSRLQPLCWNQRWQGRGCQCSYGRSCTATAIAERDDPSISSPNHRQPPEDGSDEKKGTMPPSQEVSCRSALKSTWLSIILAIIQGSMIVIYVVMCSDV